MKLQELVTCLTTQAVIAHAGRIFTFDVNTGAIQSIVGGYTGKAASICLIPNECVSQ